MANLQRAWRRCSSERAELLRASDAASLAAWLCSELPQDLLEGVIAASKLDVVLYGRPLVPAASSVPESLADLQRAWRRCCTEAYHERVALLCACGAAHVAAWLRAELPLDLLNGILCALASGFAHKKATGVNIQGSKTSQANAAGAADHGTLAARQDSSACKQEPPAEEGLSLCQVGAASTADAGTNSTLVDSSSCQTGVVAKRGFMRCQADAAFAADMLTPSQVTIK